MKLKTKTESVNHVLDNIDILEIVDKKTGYSVKMITTVFNRNIKTLEKTCKDFDVIVTDAEGRKVKKHPNKDVNNIYKYIKNTMKTRKKSPVLRYYVVKTMLAINVAMKKQKVKVIPLYKSMMDVTLDVIESIKYELINNMEE